MTDLENRLRAAMESSVAAEHPPANLVARVQRRYRWHLARLGTVGIAAVLAAAFAVPLAQSALVKGATTRPAAPAGLPLGQVYDCAAQTYGALQPNWRSFAVHVGPLWIINRGIGPEFDFRNPLDDDAERVLGLTLHQCALNVVRGERYKYVHFTKLAPLFFDLDADPGETRNLAADPAYAPRVLEYAQKLLSWRMNHDEQTLTHLTLTSDGPVSRPSPRY